MSAGDLEDEAWLKLGVAAALAKQHAEDQRQLLESLAGMLEQVLPEETQVVRRGGLFSRKVLTGVTLQVPEGRFSLHDPGSGPLRATFTRVVRGIALKTEDLPVEEWLETVATVLDERARLSAEVRSALLRFIG